MQITTPLDQGCYTTSMIWLLTLLVLLIVALLVGACWVVFALLKGQKDLLSELQRVATGSIEAASRMQAQVPGQIETVLAALKSAIEGHNASFDATIKTVLAPPETTAPLTLAERAKAYGMPVPDSMEHELGDWDHTDFVDQGREPGDWPPPPGGRTDPGYEFESEPGFDPNNPLGIPGLTAPVVV